MKTLTLVSLLLWLTCFPAARGWGQTFRVATYNVNFDNSDAQQMLETIRVANSDVVCIQETSARWFRLFQSELSDQLPHQQRVGEYAMLAKAPLEGLVAAENGAYAIATCQLGSRRVQVVNAHLAPLDVPADPNPLAMIQELADSDQKHLEQLRSLSRELNAEPPTVIVGDFNGVSVSKAARFLRESGFVDSFAAVHEMPDQTATWSLAKMLKLESRHYPQTLTEATRGVEIRLRIDYIYHSQQLQTKSSRVISRDCSDHDLVVSELGWKDP